MRHSIRTAVVTTAVAVVLALTASPASAKSYFAERFDSLIRVMPGGALEITETVVFRFESGTFDHVFREIPTAADGRHRDRRCEHGRPSLPGWRRCRSDRGLGPIEGAGAVAIRAGQRHEPRVRPHLPRARGRHAGSRRGRARVAGAAPRAPVPHRRISDRVRAAGAGRRSRRARRHAHDVVAPRRWGGHRPRRVGAGAT